MRSATSQPSTSPSRPTARPGTPGRQVILLSLGFLLAGCGGGTRGEGGAEGDSAAPVVDAGAAPLTSPTGCVLEGDWTLCAVEDRLVHAGVVLERKDGEVQHPFFSVPGVAFEVGTPDHQLQLFIYPTADARRRDTEALDSATASPPGTRVNWPAPPTLVTSNNLAAIILSLNDRTVERLALALGAGLPQPQR